MKKMTKKILTFVLASAMMLSGAACSNTESQSTEEETTETEEADFTSAETTETAAETIAETSAETEPESTVWGDNNDLTFGISELTLPNYTYARLGEDAIEGSGVDEDVVYSIPSVDVSEPDEDGYVTYTIDYTLTGTYDQEFAFDEADHTDGWSSTPQQYNVVDYYTGTYLCVWENCCNTDGEEIAVTIDSGDEDITVYVSGAFDNDITENESYDIDDDHWGWHVEYTVYMTITLRAPQSYDGMLLEINTAGWTEECYLENLDGDGEAVDVVEGDIFADDISSCRFTWASDLIIEG